MTADAMALARTIEPLAAAAWPAHEMVLLGGWLLRFTDGFSQRANSVAPLAFTGADLETRIDATEAAYRAHHLPPKFHVTPAAAPEHLEEALRARGYGASRHSYVCVANTSEVRGRLGAAANVLSCGVGDPRFCDLVTAGSRSPADGRERLDILARLALPHVCILVEEAGLPVACGVGVKTADWASFYVMRSDAAHRRRGHARRALAGLAGWAEAQGTRRLFLQVEDGNLPARQLYAGAGFVPAYSYRFLVRG